MPLLNLGIRDNDRTLIFLILEKYLLGLNHHSGKLVYCADQDGFVNTSFIRKVFSDELAIQI